MSNEHENVIHAMADKLLDFFEGSGAVNYIEQTFGCNDNPSKSFVVTMQKVEGLTPCQKLAATEQRVEELTGSLEEIKRIASAFPQDKTILEVAGKALGVS